MNIEITEVLNDYTKNLNQILFEIDLFVKDITEKSIDIDKETENTLQVAQNVQQLVKNSIPSYHSNIEMILELLNNIKHISGGMRYSDILSLLISHKDSIKNKIKALGISFMKKDPTRVPQNDLLLKSITNEIWLELVSNLNQNQQFHNIAKKSLQFFNKNLEEQLNKQLKIAYSKNPKISPEEINQYKLEFKKSRIHYDDFFKSKSTVEMQKTTDIKISSLDEEESEKPINPHEVMKSYFNADDRALARIKRTGKLPDKQTQRRVKKKSEPE